MLLEYHSVVSYVAILKIYISPQPIPVTLWPKVHIP